MIVPLIMLYVTFALSDEVRIGTPKDLVELSNNVSSRIQDYSGTTVFLDNDLFFDGEELKPVGKNDNNCFRGVFDGKGHIISNLHMNTSFESSGLFGYSEDSTIKNIVISSSSSFSYSQTVSDAGSAINLGSIVGYCSGCTIENNVNMATITFNGHLSEREVAIGGIGARIRSSYPIKNSANYGTITHSGSVTTTSIGGVVGVCLSPKTKAIQNCANYGVITYSGSSTKDLNIGGVLGNSWWGDVIVENCVSAGKISSDTKSNYIGSIVGTTRDGETTSISKCYWTSNVGYNNEYGDKESNPSGVTVSDSTLTDLDASTLSKLNDFAKNNDNMNKWVLNADEEQITFVLSNNKGFTVSSKLVVLPDPIESDGLSFWGWFSDPYCTSNYTSSEVDESTTLYGLYGKIVTVEFDGNEGTPSHPLKYVTYSDNYGILPGAERVGYTFNGWYDNNEGSGNKTTPTSTVSTLSSHTLYATWIVSRYMLTFDYGNGTMAYVDVLYNETIEYPEDVVKEGYTFVEWSNFTERMPPNDLVITALWKINQYNITFVFDNGDKNEVRVLDYNETVVYPENVEKTGYTFNGWSQELERMPAESITITALWSINNYTITFVFNNGTENDVRVLNYNEAIVYPENVLKEGYTFNGWSPKPDRILAEGITTTAQWTKNNYTITFTFDNGNIDEEKVIDFGEAIEYPEYLTKEGYVFNGWSPKPETMPAKDITVTAQWTVKYKITFDCANGSVIEESFIYNDIINYPEDPVKEGHMFNGWIPNPDVMPENDIVVMAQWVPNNYTITFVIDNDISNVTEFKYNESITYPENIVKLGHTFVGWSPMLERMPANNITINANWIINNYSITFDFNNGEENEMKIYSFNEIIDYPVIPKREGYTFNGWSPKPERMIAENLTIVAQWAINTYSITFDFGNDAVTTSLFEYNGIIEYPKDPIKEGYLFIGWDTKPERMTANNVTLVAQWIEANQFVEITFKDTDLTESEIISILNEFTNSTFHIDSFELDTSTGSTQVIIKFDDPIEAHGFVRNVNIAIRNGNEFIREVTSTNNSRKEQYSFSHRVSNPLSIILIISILIKFSH